MASAGGSSSKSSEFLSGGSMTGLVMNTSMMKPLLCDGVCAAAPPVPTLGMPSVLPYDGDRDINVAIQTALTRNDTTALRILFQAQKMRSK